MSRLGRCTAALACAVLLLPAAAIAAKDQLVIGISQFPSGFNPNLESHVALSFIDGKASVPTPRFLAQLPRPPTCGDRSN